VAGEINVEGRLVIGDKGIVRADVNTVDALMTFQANLKPQRRQRASMTASVTGSGGSGTTTPR